MASITALQQKTLCDLRLPSHPRPPTEKWLRLQTPLPRECCVHGGTGSGLSSSSVVLTSTAQARVYRVPTVCAMAWLTLSTVFQSRATPEEPSPFYLVASGTHWCCHDSLFMCNFWLRLESGTTALFSKQPLPLYKKQAISRLGCQTKISIPSAPRERNQRGLFTPK